ncbi:hypothetical protein [Roseococcus sp. YIM B11640]|uniref:hypothetical protein n=1 Tax=Roseococcus sp. YIM B11640 TaxID=3133973 RepID=UPI003C7E38DF
MTPPEQSANAPRALLAVLTLLPAAVFLLTVVSPPLNHDVAAVLDFSMRWRNGEALYRDLIDMNPPLVFMLTRGVIALADMLRLPPIPVLIGCVLALCLMSAVAALPLRRGLAEGAMERRALDFGLPLILLTAGYDFAQREHLMLAAALPYLVLAARRAEGVSASRATSLAAALLAAVGFALKPHFLILPALVELYVLCRRGLAAFRDPVPWVMAAVWLGYLGLIFGSFPDYPGFTLPLALEYYHSHLGFRALLLNEWLTPAALLFVPCAVLALRRPGGLAPVLALAGLGALLAALIQGRAWSYHAMPVRLLGGLLAVQLAARWLDAALPAGRAARAAPGFAAIGAGLLGLLGMLNPEAPWREANYRQSWPHALERMLERAARHGRVLVLSPDIHPVFPAINYAGALSTLTTLNTWLIEGANQECLPGGARYREPEAMGPGERLMWDRTIRDFTESPPEALLVAQHTAIPYCGADWDHLAYFSRDAAFAATLQRYRLISDFASYRIFERGDP